MKVLVALRRSCTFILAYFVCWHLSEFLEVAPSTSVFYPACGVVAYFIYRWGWRYLAVAAVAIEMGALPQVPIWDLSVFDALHTLRQLVAYGGLALLARQYRGLILPLDTLHATIRLLRFALLSTLLSAVLAMGIFWFQHPSLRDYLTSLFFSFWVGDFSGMLMLLGFVSVVLALKQHTKSMSKPCQFTGISPTAISLTATSAGVVALMAILAANSALHSYGYLILLPVIIGTVVMGIHFGIVAAILTNVSAVATYMALSTDQMPAFQFQLLCAVVMCVAMVLGGAVNDRSIARFDAWHDQLTGLLNRRGFFEQGEMMLERAKRYHYNLALIMLDLDCFKLVNDTYGHDAGDRLLCAVAEQCKGITRAGDLCARIGGEEFVLLIEHSDEIQAAQIAERLRLMIFQLKRGTSQDTASASFGVSISSAGKETLAELLFSSDKLLYIAKNTGRNRVVLASQIQSVMTDVLRCNSATRTTTEIR